MVGTNQTAQRLPHPRAHRLKVPNLSQVNFERLRRERLSRFQDAMRRNDHAIALLYNPANIRYCTGPTSWACGRRALLHAMRWFPRKAGRSSLSILAPSMFRLQSMAMCARRWGWNQSGRESYEKARRWAESVKSAMRELNASGETLALDKCDSTGFQALQNVGVQIGDVNVASLEARIVKTQDEIDLMKINGGIGDAVMAEFEAAIRPGIREYELLAVLSNALLRNHGEFLFTRLVASGTNTNPWMTEAHDKIVMPGDLVGIDTDMNGYEGYVIDISRTFLCGDNPTAEQKEAYRIAYDCVIGMLDLVKPGMSFAEFADKAPRLPEPYVAQRYGAMLHHAGLEDEGPTIPYPYGEGSEDEIMPEGQFEEGMILCLECYAGKLGGTQGVKLEDQVLVTRDDAELICTYPYDAKLLS